MDVKRVIKGVAKTTGKYTLKGLGKGLELTTRGAIKGINVLVKVPIAQKIATGAGILTASVFVPPVGVALIVLVGLKLGLDKVFKDNNKNILDETKDILEKGNHVTKNTIRPILSKSLDGMDKGIKKLGKNYQSKIDSLFK